LPCWCSLLCRTSKSRRFVAVSVYCLFTHQDLAVVPADPASRTQV